LLKDRLILAIGLNSSTTIFQASSLGRALGSLGSRIAGGFTSQWQSG
jgi:hypothetical protein